MKIRTRLLLGFALVVLLVIVVSVVGLRILISNAAMERHVSRLGQVQVALLEARRHEKNFLLRGDESYAQKTTRWLGKVEEVSKEEANLVDNDRAMQEHWLSIVRFESDYVKRFQAYVDYLKNPSLNRNDPAVKARMEAYDQEMIQAARRVHTALESIAAEMSDQNSEGHTYAKSLFLGAVIVAIAVAIVVILLVMKSVTRSLKMGTQLAKEIGEGRLDVPLGNHGNDEIGQFLKSMETMRGDLVAMEKQNLRALTSRIAISALLETTLEPFSMEEQLKVALQIILNMSGLRVQKKGAIFLTDEETGVLRLVVTQGLPEALWDTCGQVEPGRCLCGKVLQTGKMLVAQRGDERHSVASPGMEEHGHCCFPIVSRGKVLGIVSLYLTEDRVMEHEEALLTTIGFTLAGIIERRRLEAHLQQLTT